MFGINFIAAVGHPAVEIGPFDRKPAPWNAFLEPAAITCDAAAPV